MMRKVLSKPSTVVIACVVSLLAITLLSTHLSSHFTKLSKDEFLENISTTVYKASLQAFQDANKSSTGGGSSSSFAETPTSTERALRDARLRVNFSKIFMSPIEADLVLRYLVADGGINTYLEWGSGGSTTNFAQFARKRAYSIEHTEEWCNRMRPIIAASPSLTHLNYRCIALPHGNSAEGSYKEYQPYVDEISNLNETSFDFVLVDGRARVDCAIKTLSYITDKSVVVLHDASRINDADHVSYRAVLDYYDTIDIIGGEKRQGMFIMKRKAKLANLEGKHKDVQQILRDRHAK